MRTSIAPRWKRSHSVVSTEAATSAWPTDSRLGRPGSIPTPGTNGTMGWAATTSAPVDGHHHTLPIDHEQPARGALINFTKRRVIILALLTITGLAAGYIGFNLVLDALLGGRFLW